MWALPQWRSRNSRWWIIFPRVVEIQLENVNKTTSSCPVAFLCFLEAMRHSFNPPQCCSHSKKKQPSIIHHQISGDEDSSKLQWVDPPGVSKTDVKHTSTPSKRPMAPPHTFWMPLRISFWYGAWLGKWAKNGPNCWLSGDFLCLGRLGKGERSPSWSSAKQWCTDHSCAALGSGIQDNSTAQ